MGQRFRGRKKKVDVIVVSALTREHLLWSRECCLSESSQYSLEVFFIALNKFWFSIGGRLSKAPGLSNKLHKTLT